LILIYFSYLLINFPLCFLLSCKDDTPITAGGIPNTAFLKFSTDSGVKYSFNYKIFVVLGASGCKRSNNCPV
jgi:hypothetical protein